MKRKFSAWIGLVSIMAGSLAAHGAPMPPAAELERAFRHLQSYTWSENREPLNVMETAIQASANDPAARKQLETRLAAVLKTGAQFPAKQYACRKLSEIGTADCIPALTPLLVDPALSHPARFALERISGPKALESLRQALPRAEGNTKVGIINSLGALKDVSAVELLTQVLLKDSDAQIARAAASALGQIATADAARALGEAKATAPKPVLPAIAQALLVAARRMLENGHRAEAAAIFRQLHAPEEPLALRLPALKGLVAAEPERAFDLLLNALAGEDARVREFAARVLAEDPSAPPLKLFLERDFQAYPLPAQIALLEASRARREPTARLAALKAAQSSDSQVRIAGFRALAAIGTPADVQLLVRHAAGQGEEKNSARAALVSLPGQEANATMVTELRDGPPEVAVELLNALGARAALETAPDVAVRMSDPNQPVRSAALKALAMVGTCDQVPALVTALNAAANDTQREAATTALMAVVDRAGAGCAENLVKGLTGANPDSRMALLRILASAGGPDALSAVRAALTDADKRVQEAAFEALTDWPSIDAAPELLGLARTSAEANQRVLAFRGFVRVCREAECSGTQRLSLLGEAMKAAGTPEEKRLVIAALGDQRDFEALKILNPCLDDPTLAQEACLAAVNIASEAKAEDKANVVPCLMQVGKVATNPDLRQKARSILQRLGANNE